MRCFLDSRCNGIISLEPLVISRDLSQEKVWRDDSGQDPIYRVRFSSNLNMKNLHIPPRKKKMPTLHPLVFQRHNPITHNMTTSASQPSSSARVNEEARLTRLSRHIVATAELRATHYTPLLVSVHGAVLCHAHPGKPLHARLSG